MRDQAVAADTVSGRECRSKGKVEERRRETLSLPLPIDRKLGEQDCRYRVGLIALPALWKGASFDLGGAKRNEAGDCSGPAFTNDIGAGRAQHLVSPGMPMKPGVEGGPPAIEGKAVVVFLKRARAGQSSHAGLCPASFISAGISFAGAWHHASKFSQASAGIVTTRRSIIVSSAASIAWRRT